MLRVTQKNWLKSIIICSSLSLPIASLADSIQPNCDMRQLSLKPAQKAKLRQMRQEHKLVLEKALKSTQKTNQDRRATIYRILSAKEFDQTQAERYVQDKYEARMRFEVEELAVQHSFFQLLMPQQQQIWLHTCVR
ncbi:MAG: hypothetical protein WBO82_06065 [Neisseria sp.]